MSLITVFESAIQARAASDGTLVNLVGGSGLPQFTNIFGPSNLVFPYVVYAVRETTVNDSFTNRASLCEIEFHVFDKVDNGNVNAQAILVRLLGDWPIQANRQATFGFDRWVPDLSASGWSTGLVTKVGADTAHELTVLHYIERYQSYVSFL